MSAWRRKAIETFPDLRNEFQAPDATIYTIFFELLARHQNATELAEDELERIYGFAEWCYRQRGELSNAAAVSFYEHCGEREHVREQFIRRVPIEIYRVVRPLFVGCIAERHVAALDLAFERKATTSRRAWRTVVTRSHVLEDPGCSSDGPQTL